MEPAITSAVSTQIFIAMLEVLTTVVSQFVILYWKPKVWVVHASELPVDMTSRFSLFVGGGTGVFVNVWVTVGVGVFVRDMFMVGVTVGVYSWRKSGRLPESKSSVIIWIHPW
jgi:hypothetical protein